MNTEMMMPGVRKQATGRVMCRKNAMGKVVTISIAGENFEDGDRRDNESKDDIAYPSCREHPDIFGRSLEATCVSEDKRYDSPRTYNWFPGGEIFTP